MVKAVIFDRDGVIIDGEGNHIESVRSALKELGKEMEDSDVNMIVARHTRDYADYFCDKYEVDKENFFEIQKREYYAGFDNIALYEKTVELIKKLKKDGFVLALTTSSHRKSTYDKLKSIEILDCFNVIVGFEDCSKRKPDPEPYLLTLEKLGLDAKDCIVIEDSGHGVNAANDAGIRVIAIPNNYTKDQDFSKASWVVKSADEIYDIIKNN